VQQDAFLPQSIGADGDLRNVFNFKGGTVVNFMGRLHWKNTKKIHQI